MTARKPKLKRDCQIICDVAPAEAQVVWDSMKLPSSAKVTAVFRSCGRHVSAGVIRKWHRNGWQPVLPQRNLPPTNGEDQSCGRGDGQTPLSVTIEDVKRVIGNLTGDPNLKIEDLTPFFSAAMPRNYRPQNLPEKMLVPVHDPRSLVQLIDGMTDIELLRETNRRAQGLCMAVFNEIDRQRMLLVNDNPDSLGSLFRALAGFLEAANMGAKHYLDVKERAMLEINPTGRRGRGELDDDMTADLEKFRDVGRRLATEGDKLSPVTIDATPAPRAPLQS